ncbi:BTAD domain-containing putative transcriptional regulator [Streptomyces sp. NPDC059740]|uniref:AfsR/SARP family transcriptional regulator n=1 Tax=Streptomyces sp. NPDC059740 TaxID=3346926 RepID=UPI0036662424
MSFAVLGPLEVQIAGARLRLGGLITARVLTMLLLSPGRMVPVPRLVEAAWDAEPPATAAHQVRKAVADLRQRIPDGQALFVTDNPGYRIDVATEQLDLSLFTERLQQARQALDARRLSEAVERLRGALALWRGPVMADSGGPVIAAASAVLEERRLAAVGQLIDLRLDTGESAELIDELRQLVVEYPLRETFRGQLMLAFHRSGRRAEALAAYAETRRLLVEELGIEPGRQLSRLHESILRDGPEEAVEQGAPAASPGEAPPAPRPAAPPCTLPYDLSDFAGRRRELRTLLSRAVGQADGDRTMRIIALVGMGGSGKTALAVRAAHHLAHAFPDGQFFTDLRGFTPGEQPRAPGVVLGALLRTLGVPGEQIPEDLDGRTALWRTTLAGRRVLLVLDNAADAAQVRPLLPATAGALVLITSRRRMVGLDGADALSLGVLAPEESVALLTAALGEERSGSECEEVGELADICAHLPLALRIAAARLRSRPHWSVRYLVDRLRDESRRLDELRSDDRGVEATLRLSYEAMDERHRVAFRLLGLHPGTEIDLHSAAALLGTGLQEAEDVLEHLTDIHLIEPHEISRYAFHDLVRRFARRLSDQEDEPAAFERVLDYYLAATENACRIRYPGREATEGRQVDCPSGLPEFTGPRDAEAFFDREQVTLLVAVERAVEQGRYGHAVRLARNLIFHLNTRSQLQEYRQAASLAVVAARELRDPRALRLSLSNLSVVQWKLGEFRAGIESTTEALDVAVALGDRDGEAACLSMLGLLHSCLGHLAEAQRCLEAAVELYAGMTAGRQEGYACSNLSTVYVWQGRPEEAVAVAERAVLLSRGFGPFGEEITALTDLAIAHLAAGDVEQARRTTEQALELGDEKHVPENLALAYAVAADVNQRLGRDGPAAACADRSLALIRARAGTTIRQATVENILGGVRRRAGHYRQALELHRSAHRHAHAIDFQVEVANALAGMAAVRRELGVEE